MNILDLALESPTIDSSLLTKFWKICTTEDILEEMLKKTVQQALDKRLVKSGLILRKTFCGRKSVAYSGFLFIEKNKKNENDSQMRL